MAGRTLRIAGLLVGLSLAGCESHHGPTVSSASLSTVGNASIRALTPQFSDRTVQYEVTAAVSNPENLVGGTAELKVASSGEARKQGVGLTIGQIIAQTPITQQSLFGNQLTALFDLPHPPAGTLSLTFGVLDPRGFETNFVHLPPIVILLPPPPPPVHAPAPPQGTIVIRVLELPGGNFSMNGHQSVSHLSIFGPTTLGPLTVDGPLGTSFSVFPGSYTTSAADGYFAPLSCLPITFGVAANTTTTLVYSLRGNSKPPPSFSVTCLVSVS